MTGELGRDLDQGFGDQHSHGVEVAAVGAQPQALRFQGDGTAAAEGVQHGRGVLDQEALDAVVGDGQGQPFGAGDAAGDFLAGGVEHGLVVGVLPEHQLLDQAKEALALAQLVGVGRELLGDGAGVINEGGEEDGAAGGQGAAGPPEVEGGGVAVANALLTRRGFVDGLQRQGDFDELLAGGRGCFLG